MFPARWPPSRRTVKSEWRREDSRRISLVAVVAQRLAAQHRLEWVDPVDRFLRVDPVDRFQRLDPVDRVRLLHRVRVLGVLGRECLLGPVRGLLAFTTGLAVTIPAVRARCLTSAAWSRPLGRT